MKKDNLFKQQIKVARKNAILELMIRLNFATPITWGDFKKVYEELWDEIENE